MLMNIFVIIPQRCNKRKVSRRKAVRFCTRLYLFDPVLYWYIIVQGPVLVKKVRQAVGLDLHLQNHPNSQCNKHPSSIRISKEYAGWKGSQVWTAEMSHCYICHNTRRANIRPSWWCEKAWTLNTPRRHAENVSERFKGIWTSLWGWK